MQRVRDQILRGLKKAPHTFWQLLPLQDGHWIDLVRTLQQLQKENLVELQDGYFSLTGRGKEVAPRELQPTTCPTCEGKGLTAQGIFQETLTSFRQLTTNRPRPLKDFDQGYISPEDTVARIIFLYRHADLEDKNLLFLGDDDLTGLAAALTGLPRQVVVLDVDQRLADFMRATGAGIDIRTYDVRYPLPDDLQGRFDAVCTDPTETVPGFSLFLSRAIAALKEPGGALYFGLTTLESNRTKWHHLQQMILDAGFVITDILPGFHRYSLPEGNFITEEYLAARELPFGGPDPSTKWYTSSFYRVEAVTELRAPYRGQVEMGEELYVEPVPE